MLTALQRPLDAGLDPVMRIELDLHRHHSNPSRLHARFIFQGIPTMNGTSNVPVVVVTCTLPMSVDPGWSTPDVPACTVHRSR